MRADADKGGPPPRYGAILGTSVHPGLLFGGLPSLAALRFNKGGGGYLCPGKFKGKIKQEFKSIETLGT